MDFIYTAPNALPDSFCDELIARYEGHSGKQPGRTSGGLDLAKKVSTDLTLEGFEDLLGIRHRMLNIVLDHLADYFMLYPFFGSVNPSIRDSETGETMEVTIENCSSLSRETLKVIIARMFQVGTINIQKYVAGSGGYPYWHCEITPEKSFTQLHRLVLWMYYLNDVEVGGETEFYFQKMKIQPRKGTVVIAPAGFTHTHRGNKPLSGDKYIITSWLLFARGGVYDEAP